MPPFSSSVMSASPVTFSSSFKLIKLTPWVLRPTTEMSEQGMRMVWPLSVVIITSSVSRTLRVPTTLPTLSVVFCVMIPTPPRD